MLMLFSVCYMSGLVKPFEPIRRMRRAVLVLHGTGSVVKPCSLSLHLVYNETMCSISISFRCGSLSRIVCSIVSRGSIACAPYAP